MANMSYQDKVRMVVNACSVTLMLTFKLTKSRLECGITRVDRIRSKPLSRSYSAWSILIHHDRCSPISDIDIHTLRIDGIRNTRPTPKKIGAHFIYISWQDIAFRYDSKQVNFTATRNTVPSNKGQVGQIEFMLNTMHQIAILAL